MELKINRKEFEVDHTDRIKVVKEHDEEHHCCHRYTNFLRYSLNDSINAVLEDIKSELLERSFSVTNPYNTYAYINVVKIKDIERVIDKYINGKE